MSMFAKDSLPLLKRWQADAKALKDDPRLHAVTPIGRPDLPGRDWYKLNYEEITAEIERRERKQ